MKMFKNCGGVSKTNVEHVCFSFSSTREDVSV